MVQNSSWVSLVVPVRNNIDQLGELIQRVDSSMQEYGVGYELIFIDDYSADGTLERLQELRLNYPIVIDLMHNQSQTSAVLQGLGLARYSFVATIDLNRSCPVEVLPSMLQLLIVDDADLVVADCQTQPSLMSRVGHRMSKLLIGRAAWGLRVNSHSGLKVMRRDVLERLQVSPNSAAFDLELLARSRSGGYRIANYAVDASAAASPFVSSPQSTSLRKTLAASIALRFSDPDHLPFSSAQVEHKGRGFHFRGQEYVHHSNLSHHDTALRQVSLKQKLVLLAMLAVIITALIVDWRLAIKLLIGTITFMYFVDLMFNLNLIFWSMFKNPEVKVEHDQLSAVPESEWPRYTILCPLYKESEVLGQFIAAMKAIDYDPAKLQILLLIEEDDETTSAAIDRHDLPAFFEKVVVPYSLPKTKPKACNYGLARATGEFVVIYDAEDIPDPLQLKKAYVTFRQSSSDVACVQSKLNFYNPSQNVLTRAFTAEYSLWFNLLLTGMQYTNTPIPLGGTSNHFRTSLLRELGGWDAFNVTEDADLGVRLVKRGYKTMMVDSTTLEEANSNLKNWFWQRTRWIKGYIQTQFVHTRSLKQFRIEGRRNLNGLLFQFVIGGKVLSMLINPLLWLLTIFYFVFRLQVGAEIDAFFPPAVLYMGVLSLIFGNFLYLYYYMLGCVRTGRYELVRYSLFIPLYWIAMSAAAYYALFEVFIKPHHWRKTKHGLHLSSLNTAEVHE